MAQQKQREIFNIGGFRGLDTENSLDTVEKYRAADGYNFQIASNKLKTRPALVNDTHFIIGDKHIVGVHKWKNYDVVLAVENNPEATYHSYIYIFDGVGYKGVSSFGTESNTTNSGSIFTNLDSFNFIDKEPFFVEEKDCLFIFCVDDVLVLSKVTKDDRFAFVVYSINQKIDYVDKVVENADYASYEKLPEAYVPTIQIGDNFFEDVNLLSNKRRYKLFNYDKGDVYNEFTLLGDYDPAKNGELNDAVIDVGFYGQNLNAIERVPIFLGVQGELTENYEEDDLNYFVAPNSVEIINETYVSTEIWEFLEGEDLDVENDVPLSQSIGLTKEKAMKLILQNKSTVFEYLQNLDTSDWDIGGREVIYKFSLKIEFMYRIIDAEDKKTVKSYGHKGSCYRYIYFGFLNASSTFKWTLEKSKIYFISSYKSSDDPQITDFSNILIPTNKPNTKTVIELENEVPKFNTAYNVGNDTYFWSEIKSDFIKITVNYPTVLTPFGTSSSPLTSEQIAAVLKWFRRTYQDSFPEDVNEAHIRVMTQKMIEPGLLGNPPIPPTYENSLFVLKLTLNEVVGENFYDVENTDSGIKIKIRSDFINYNVEPAITVDISFADNDYNFNLIAKNKFGTTFGSESRVFLAGNPDFKHIDRYNVSNDLLGDNVVSQSYELSYFPSKNYRVVGGSSSAINGYVVATDTQLYVTKNFAVNDSCLYIRTRNITESGQTSFFEYKTNIMKSPINNRCIVNFYNDIVMLTKDGLLGIEISSNVLTNERLLKLRSGFINKMLKESVKTAENVFCAEEGERLYMVADNEIYVADARYVAVNENAKIENLSYEIVKWTVEPSFKRAIKAEEGVYFFDDNRSYIFSDAAEDKKIHIIENAEITIDEQSREVSINEELYHEIEDNDVFYLKNFYFSNAYLMLFSEYFPVDSSTNECQITIEEEHIDKIEMITGKQISELDMYVGYIPVGYMPVNSDIDFVKVDDFSVGHSFIIENCDEFIGFFADWTEKPLYIKKTQNEGIIEFRARPYYDEQNDLENPALVVQGTGEFYYYFEKFSPIEMKWVSGLLDFGNKLYEKTMYSLSFYVKKDKNVNFLQYGYKTMRSYQDFKDLLEVQKGRNKMFDFSDTDFNIFSMSTIEHGAILKKKKENNFLYIQFMIFAIGSVEINDFLVYYKNNRKNKLIS